jgi:DNA replication and repair protein RecF
MQLDRIKLSHFKNYENGEAAFSERLNCFVGKNGMGKTNLLDAIYYLCMSKSYLQLQDRNLLLHGKQFFRLEGDFYKNGLRERLVAKVWPSKEKVLELNGSAYERLADHVGVFPVVFIAPDDQLMAREGSEERRRFLDNTLSQLDAAYLRQLMEYNRVLRQRNALLKQNHIDKVLLRAYDRQLVALCEPLHCSRVAFYENFNPIFDAFYQKLCGGEESATCDYRSALSEMPFSQLLEDNLGKDIMLQRSTQGIHRDDIIFKINGMAVKRFASQGQLKSYIMALKLAQYQCLAQGKGVLPLLLLDDIFDRLDDFRVARLLGILRDGGFGQVFVTDTHEERVLALAAAFAAPCKLFEIEKGSIKSIKTLNKI